MGLQILTMIRVRLCMIKMNSELNNISHRSADSIQTTRFPMQVVRPGQVLTIHLRVRSATTLPKKPRIVWNTSSSITIASVKVRNLARFQSISMISIDISTIELSQLLLLQIHGKAGNTQTNAKMKSRAEIQPQPRTLDTLTEQRIRAFLSQD